MPTKSPEQQKLFGMALSVRRGNTKRSDVSDNVLKIADGNMTTKELEKMATMKEEQTPQESSGEYGIRWSEFNKNSQPITKQRFFVRKEERDTFAKKIENKDNFYKFIAWSNPKTESKQSMKEGQGIKFEDLYVKIINAVMADVNISMKQAKEIVDNNETYLRDMVEFQGETDPVVLADIITTKDESKSSKGDIIKEAENFLKEETLSQQKEFQDKMYNSLNEIKHYSQQIIKKLQDARRK